MPRRNLAEEFEAMGIESDDSEYQELEAKDRKHQEAACERDYHKDAVDFIAWRRKHRPAGWKYGQGPKKSTDSSC